MNEEIVMHLSSAADRWERTHPIIGFGELRVHDALRDAVRCIKETSAKVPKWISVKERLPEESGYYLYLCDSPSRGLQNGVGVSYFQHKAKLWKKVYNPCVTHWMPLPEALEEEG